MKTKIPNLRRPDILGNGDRLSDEEILTATLRRWRHRLAYCSIFAAVPAMLASHISEARSDEPKKAKLSVAGQEVKRPEKLNIGSNSALLKRQSKFLLPHQKGSFSVVAALAGNDDCPGRPIPGGSYTAASAYTDTGDTTGANNTVGSINSNYYYYYF